MKWFKHDAHSMRNASVERLIMEYGIDGYGLYWACIELIAGNISIRNLTFELEHDAELIANKFKMDTIRVERIMHRCIELRLFELADSGRLRCPELARMLDETTSKNPYIKKMKDKLLENTKKALIPETFRSDSGDSPTRLDKTRSDKIRKEEKRETAPRTRLVKPTVEQIQEYMDKMNITKFSAQLFFDKNEGRGWVTGKANAPIKDWKAVVRIWNTYEVEKKNPQPDAYNLTERLEADKKRDKELKNRLNN